MVFDLHEYEPGYQSHRAVVKIVLLALKPQVRETNIGLVALDNLDIIHVPLAGSYHSRRQTPSHLKFKILATQPGVS